VATPPPQQHDEPHHDEAASGVSTASRPSARSWPRPALAAVGASATAGVALAALVLLVSTGHAWPPAPAFLVFVALLALSIHHDVVFPNEYAASADVAVVVAAVIAFRHDAPFVGPLLLGLLAGPLDVVQWERRAFVRVAWNSGDRALAGLGAAGAFAAVTHAGGSAVVVAGGAAVAAAGAATLVDGTLSVLLATALGATFAEARRAVVEIDALQFPLACAGAAAGFLVGALGWWAVAPPMFAVVLLPELVQARARVPAEAVRDVLLALEVALAAALVVPFVAVPDPLTVCGLLALAVLVGAELRVDTRVGIPGVLGVVVVTAALAVSGDAGVFTGLIVAAGATAVSWCCTRVDTRRRTRTRAAVAVALAALAGGVAGALVDTVARAGLGALGVATAAVIVFAAATLLVTPSGDAGDEAMRLVWTLPVAALGVGAAVVGITLKGLVAALPVGLVGLGALVVAWCGATPWRSRVLSRHLGALPGGGRTRMLLVLAAAAPAAAVWGCLANGNERVAAALVVVGTAALATAMALAATRQWRFATRARRRDAALLLAGAMGVAVAGVGVVSSGWWSVALVVLALVPASTFGRCSVARSDAAAAPLVASPRR
jgi:hypothetical protein